MIYEKIQKSKPIKNINTDHITILRFIDILHNVKNRFVNKLVLQLIFKKIPRSRKKIEKGIDSFYKFLYGDKKEVVGVKDFDIMEDIDYVRQSFILLYNIDIYNEKMHFYNFIDRLQACFFVASPISKVIEIRNLNPEDYDKKQRSKIMKLKRQFALKQQNEVKYTTKDVMAIIGGR